MRYIRSVTHTVTEFEERRRVLLIKVLIVERVRFSLLRV